MNAPASPSRGTGVSPVFSSPGRPGPASPRRIEIVGGGLSGLSLGLALRRAGVPVTIHEAGAYPRHRVCGEFITGLEPGTRRVLRLDPFFGDVRYHQEVAWFRDGAPFLRHTLPAPAIALSRHTLDERLASAFVAAGGELRTHSRILPDSAPPGRVYAQGRRAASDSNWLGLKVHARGLALAAPLELHLGDRAYVGLCSVDQDTVNVCGLFRRRPGLELDRATALSAYLRASGLSDLADRLGSAELDPESHCAVSALAFGPAPNHADADDEKLSLGDAHAFSPPFTGNGMAMAFQSAALALDPILRWTRHETDWAAAVSAVREKLRARFRLRLAGSALLHLALLRPATQAAFRASARAGLVPFASLYRVTH